MLGSRFVDDVGKSYIIHVILSAAKDLARWTPRSFAALRMTCWTPLETAHWKSSLQMSTRGALCLTDLLFFQKDVPSLRSNQRPAGSVRNGMVGLVNAIRP